MVMLSSKRVFKEDKLLSELMYILEKHCKMQTEVFYDATGEGRTEVRLLRDRRKNPDPVGSGVLFGVESEGKTNKRIIRELKEWYLEEIYKEMDNE